MGSNGCNGKGSIVMEVKKHTSIWYSLDTETELIFVSLGLETPKFAGESPNFIIFQIMPLLHFTGIKLVNSSSKFDLILYPRA